MVEVAVLQFQESWHSRWGEEIWEVYLLINGDDIGENDNDIGDNGDDIGDDIGDGILAVLLVSLQVPVHGSLLPESIEVFQPLSISHFLKVNFPNYL